MRNFGFELLTDGAVQTNRPENVGGTALSLRIEGTGADGGRSTAAATWGAAAWRAATMAAAWGATAITWACWRSASGASQNGCGEGEDGDRVTHIVDE